MLHKMCLFYAYFNVLLICLQIYEYEYEYMKIESIWIELVFGQSTTYHLKTIRFFTEVYELLDCL